MATLLDVFFSPFLPLRPLPTLFHPFPARPHVTRHARRALEVVCGHQIKVVRQVPTACPVSFLYASISGAELLLTRIQSYREAFVRQVRRLPPLLLPRTTVIVCACVLPFNRARHALLS